MTLPSRHLLTPESSAATDQTRSRRSSARHTLVTGGAGFIGSHLVERLCSRGDRVTVIDDLSTGRPSNLNAVLDAAPGVRLIRARVGDALPQLNDEPIDEVYHLAAAVGVQLVVREPIRCVDTNVEETSILLRFAARARTSDGRVGVPTLLASSSEIYGKSAKTPFSEEDDVTYGPTTVGRWSYAMTKAIDEYLGLAYHAQHGLPVVITRFFNTVGPRQVGDYGMVLPRFVRAALAGEALDVHGDGKQSRCFCDVRDVVESLPRLLGAQACWGRVFNVGSDEPISIGSLAELVIRTLSSRSTVRLVPYSQAFSSGFEDLRARVPDLRRVREAIGFVPRIPLTQTIRDVASAMHAS